MSDLIGIPIEIEGLIDYQTDSVVSMEIVKKELGTVTIFAFDKGQGLSEHSAPFDAMVQIVDGEAEITLAGEPHTVSKGEILIMPANVPHALQAVNGPYKMILTMIKSEQLIYLTFIFLITFYFFNFFTSFFFFSYFLTTFLLNLFLLNFNF